jgi:hypothetical protein
MFYQKGILPAIYRTLTSSLNMSPTISLNLGNIFETELKHEKVMTLMLEQVKSMVKISLSLEKRIDEKM